MRAGWFDPRLQGRVLFPQWRQLLEYVKAVFHAPLRLWARLRCLFWLLVGYRLRIGSLVGELAAGVRRKFSGLGHRGDDTTWTVEAHG